jgi:hypothetical protein
VLSGPDRGASTFRRRPTWETIGGKLGLAGRLELVRLIEQGSYELERAAPSFSEFLRF